MSTKKKYPNLIEGENITLYKFIDFDGAEKILTNGTLILKNPKDFNDPFDSFPGMIKIDDKDHYAKSFANAVYPEMSRTDKRAVIKEIRKRSVDELQEVLYKKIYEIFRTGLRVTCFSKNYDTKESGLLWSHYAASHTGVCIGFKFNPNVDRFVLFDVTYEKELPCLSSKVLNFGQEMFPIVTTKLDIWEYEKEVRMVFNHGKQFKNFDDSIATFRLSPDFFVKVVLGYDIDKKKAEHLINLVQDRYPHMQISQMVIDYPSASLKEKFLNKPPKKRI